MKPNPKPGKYRALDIEEKLPPELEADIRSFLDYLNEPGDHLSEDCYRTEICCTLNWCLREKKLSEESYQKLKDYYVHKGIYKTAIHAEEYSDRTQRNLMSDLMQH